VRISSHGSNQLAIWIEDTLGNHVTTLFVTRFTAAKGHVKRPVALGEWTAKFDLKNASKQEIDAVTGSTPKSGKQQVTLISNYLTAKYAKKTLRTQRIHFTFASFCIFPAPFMVIFLLFNVV
jgi:hypothetical protein